MSQVKSPELSKIEEALALRPLAQAENDSFASKLPSWRPPGARGIFGGTLIAQSLVAAQCTVPSTFTIHSMHCYFINKGEANSAVLYSVEKTRSGRNFHTRIVHARQNERVIFTTMASFTKAQPDTECIQHSTPVISHLPPTPDAKAVETSSLSQVDEAMECVLAPNMNGPDMLPCQKRVHQWIRARGHISKPSGHSIHAQALAYFSDRYLFGSLSRVFQVYQFDGASNEALRALYSKTEIEDIVGMRKLNTNPEIKFIVSLDHTMYFHSLTDFRADDWVLMESETTWADCSRALVMQRMYTGSGRLIATCVQEGLARLSGLGAQSQAGLKDMI